MIPIQSSEKDFFYQKSITSDASDQWLKITRNSRNKSDFFDSWDSSYFKDDPNLNGRAFHIIHEEHRIGQICYHKIDNGEVTVDLLIYNQNDRNQGYGTSALKLICAYLEERYHVHSIWMDIPSDSAIYIKAYQKAGFSLEKKVDSSVRVQKS